MTGENGGDASLGSLETESVRPEFAHLDQLSTPELVAVVTGESQRAVDAVVGAGDAIARAVDLVVDRLRAGGRLVYVGAGTAGRIAVLDATELGPTFNVPDAMVEAVLAGGDHALRHAVEGAEDDAAAGSAAVEALGVGANDAVVGVAASGRTPFVVAALGAARGRGAATIAVVCNPNSVMAAAAQVVIEAVVGGEVVAGSSRLNAGTAQKLVLNALSTAAMVKLGKTYGNLMVDFRPTNSKLRDRATRIVDAISGVGASAARAALESAEWDTKLATVVAATGVTPEEARRALEAADGRLRAAIETASPRRRAARPARERRLGVGAALIDGRIVPGDVVVAGDRIAATGLPSASGCIAAPGLVDLQVNGYAGVDCLGGSAEDLVSLSRALARDGVLAFQPTLITSDVDRMLAAAARLGGLGEVTGGARMLGIHVEGPFLSPEQAGTHPVERLRLPDRDLARRLLASGPIRMVTLAPELPGAIELVASLSAQGVVVSLGHSAATAAQARAAFDAGARAVTHLFNAMNPMRAREPGLAGAALSDPRVAVQLIADGLHVAAPLLTLACAAAPRRWSIVTDATSVAGAPPRPSTLGEVEIAVAGGVARNRDGTIAGGASTLVSALPRLIELGVDLEDALAALTARPARLAGADDVGTLHVGARADLVVLDEHLRLKSVLIAGEPVERA